MNKARFLAIAMVALAMVLGFSFSSAPKAAYAFSTCQSGGVTYNEGDWTDSCYVSGTGSTCGPHGYWIAGCV